MSGERDQLFDAVSGRLAAAQPADAWKHLIAAGVCGFRIAPEQDGLGLSVSEAEPVMAALGETGRASPFVESSVVAAGLLAHCLAAEDVLGRMGRDGAICAVAGIDPRLRSGLSACETGGQWAVTGSAKLVLHARDATALVVVVPHERTIATFLIEHPQQYATRTYPTIDGRFAFDLVLGCASATLISLDAGEAVDATIDEAQACIAAEAAGIMRRILRDTVEYTRQRHQFGQALAGFQVIQHRLVDMHIQVRRASAIARQAMEGLDGPAASRSRLVSAAKATAALAGRYVGQQAVQLHGATGMIEDLPLSYLFKRLTVIENELRSADENIARHAQSIRRLAS